MIALRYRGKTGLVLGLLVLLSGAGLSYIMFNLSKFPAASNLVHTCWNCSWIIGPPLCFYLGYPDGYAIGVLGIIFVAACVAGTSFVHRRRYKALLGLIAVMIWFILGFVGMGVSV
jgi:hypothetical protein